MSLMRFNADQFDSILRLQRALTQSLGQPQFARGLTPSGRGVFPPLNLFEDEKEEALVVRTEIPGIDRSSLEIEALGDRLAVAGVRDIPRPEGEFRYHRRERKSGQFRRVFRLPYEVDPDKATATYRDGILTIRLEKPEAAKPRHIAIGG